MTDFFDEKPDGAVKVNLNRAILEGVNGTPSDSVLASATQQYAAPFGYGPSTGWQETNVDISTSDLFGGVYAQGLYGQMRHNHDIIAANYDYRKAAVAGLKYDIIPRSENPTVSQKLAAEAVKFMMNNIPGKSLSNFIAETYDYSNTYGHALYELYVPLHGPDKNKLHIQYIPSQQINWYNYDRKNRSNIMSVEISSGDQLYSIDGHKLAWFGDAITPGNFWGVSDLRKVLAVFLAWQEDVKNYLALRRLQKGILYFKETDAGTSNDSWTIAKNFLYQYFAGKSSPLILPNGMDINHLAADSPGLADYKTMMEYFDTKIKNALDSSLHSLGLNGTGSLALGKEVSADNRERFVAHVDEFINKMNTPAVGNADLLRKLTELLGFNPDIDTPKFTVVNNVAIRVSEQIDNIIKLVEKGIISIDDITDETRLLLFQELGLHTSLIEQRAAQRAAQHATTDYTSSMSESAAAGISYLAADPIDMYPTDAMVEAAVRGLEIRESLPPSRRGGTAVGLARARDIANRRRLSLETWKRIFSFVSRHKPVWEEQKSKLPPGEFTETKSNQAMLLWGGIDAINKAERVMKAHEALNKTE